MLTKSEAVQLLNKLGSAGEPFSFYCDFLGEKWVVDKSLALEVKQLSSGNNPSFIANNKVRFEKKPVSFATFKRAFDLVVNEINKGNSFLTNLTFETPISTDYSLEEIFDQSSAKYKLLVPDQFVVFSPETFIQVRNGQIFSYPMKGTIDASVPNAAATILSDEKEMAEHVTIVDLIRNDLSQVAGNVRVSRFRYIDSIPTHDRTLLQVSSEIVGDLKPHWQSHLGTMLSRLVPAGSISGAPKPATLNSIAKAETYKRDWYTGICGHYDGETLDTGVMIRFIKKKGNQLYYCSGSGITSQSDATSEYREMVDKVYLPFLAD